MFVSDDIIYRPRFFNPRKPSNNILTSRKNSKRRKLLIPRIKKKVPVDTVIQGITDVYCMLEDITIESDSTVESVGSGDIDTTVEAMDTSGHNTKCHHMGGPSSHVHLYHNS